MVVAVLDGGGGDDSWRFPLALVVVRHPMAPTICLHPPAAFTPEEPQVETLQVTPHTGSLASTY